MANNTISFFGDKEAQEAFIRSTINSCDAVLEHYNFVIEDISSDISNPVLQATKAPALSFLKEMRKEWEMCRSNALKALEQAQQKKGGSESG